MTCLCYITVYDCIQVEQRINRGVIFQFQTRVKMQDPRITKTLRSPRLLSEPSAYVACKAVVLSASSVNRWNVQRVVPSRNIAKEPETRRRPSQIEKTITQSRRHEFISTDIQLKLYLEDHWTGSRGKVQWARRTAPVATKTPIGLSCTPFHWDGNHSRP